jgi:hypothetical protein
MVEELKLKKWKIKGVDVIYERVKQGNGIVFSDGSYLPGPASKITIFAEDDSIKHALFSIFRVLFKSIGKVF